MSLGVAPVACLGGHVTGLLGVPLILDEGGSQAGSTYTAAERIVYFVWLTWPALCEDFTIGCR